MRYISDPRREQQERLHMGSLQGEIGVTHLGRIEDAGTYLPFLEETVGWRMEVGHLNRTSHSFRYREVYTPEMRDVVARAYAKDIEAFGNDF